MWKIQITKLKSRVIKCTCCCNQSINKYDKNQPYPVFDKELERTSDHEVALFS